MTPEALARALLRAKPTLGAFASGGHGNGSAKARFHGALAEWQVVVNEVIVECKLARWSFNAVEFRELCGYWPEREQPGHPIRHFTPARVTAVRKIVFESSKRKAT